MSQATFIAFDAREDKSGTEQAFKTLAKALSRDPVTTWLAGKSDAEAFMGSLLEMLLTCHPSTRFYATPDFTAAAMTSDSQQPEFEADADAMAATMVHVPPERAGDMETLFPSLDVQKDVYVKDHGHVVHIHMIGVRVQGQGMGAQLIQHIKDQAAKAERGVYLEASSAASTRFYSRHGFQHVREHRLHEAAPILNLMAYHPEV
ncbi:hypothetical protein ACKKBG_A35185 [Auxenochlorella protothecoides x Auxenochlorella symbiontica]